MTRTTDHNIYQAFVNVAKCLPQGIAISDAGAEVSYAALVDRSRAIAAALLAAGIDKGDRVAIWSVNRLEWIVAALGIQAAGGVLVPLSTRLRAAEVGGIMRRARAKVLFCDRSFGNYDFPDAIAAQDLPDLREVVCFDDAGDHAIGFVVFSASGSGVDDAAIDARIASITPDDVVDILFTSGTTGAPKGVPLTHRQSIVACETMQTEVINFAPGECFCVVFPFAHNAGYRTGWQLSLLYGVRVVPVRSYDAGDMLALLAREKPVYVPAAPPVFRAMLDHPDRAQFDLSSVRLAATGGTDVPVSLVGDMRRDLGVGHVITGYGLTETAGLGTTSRPGDSDDIIARTAGRPYSGLDIKCVDVDLRVVPTGTSGEIVVRGEAVLTAYFEDPAATAAAFTPDGFFRTGDIGAFDAAGNLAITGRLKDMYLVGGFNCYPAEIEQMLRSIDGVADVAVIGVPDARLGEVGHAFIVRNGRDTPTEAEVVAWARQNMANYKVPRGVTFIAHLPRNAQGKVVKTELSDLIRS
jgi:acyl-CoA synthetase (AMP-forming)/AMP-acid ligase II